MAGQAGPTKRALELCQELRESAPRFDFFAALRWIECANPDMPRLGTSLRAPEDPVRLGQEPELAFSTSALHAFGPESGSGTSDKLTVNFFGLLGANGPMPLHITEFVRSRQRDDKDSTLIAFLDVFHHRLLSLFYRAWVDATPTAQYDRPDSERFGDWIGSLLGCGTPATSGRELLDDRVRRHYAGRLAALGRSAEGLRDILADYFDVDVRLVEFVGHWLQIPTEARTRISDRETARLGVTATLGTEYFDRQQNFRVVLGPLGFDDYRRLLPDGESLGRLAALIRGYVGDEFSWEAQLVLRREEVPAWHLGDRALGWTTWLAGDVERDPDQLVLPGEPELAPVR